jgi:hypothetical protein
MVSVIFQVLTAASMKFRVVWNVTLFSHVEVELDLFVALMMEALRTSETSVNFNTALHPRRLKTLWRLVVGVTNLHSHRNELYCLNKKSEWL